MVKARFKKLKNKINKENARVLLIRHGSTPLNNEDKNLDRIRGWLDIPLNEEGIQDAKRAGKKVKNDNIKLIYSSDLIRAEQTAQLVDDQIEHCPIIIHKDLRPWNLGIYQGQISNSVQEELLQFILDETEVPQNGESFKHFKTRYLDALSKIIDHAIKDNIAIVVVTHFRNVKLCDAWVDKGMKKDYEIDMEAMAKDNFSPGDIYEVPVKEYMASRGK